MRITIALAALLALTAAGCERPQLPARAHSSDIVANSVFGAANVMVPPNLCAGRIKLAQGAATVNDSCFTGDTNVVVCTDMTAPNAVMCAPGKGALSIAGTASDMVGYARIK
jgi:hypothetical protein